MINLEDIGPDDYVIIQDSDGNVARGKAFRVYADGQALWAVRAFETDIRFAQYSRAKNWQPIGAIRVVGHTPLLPLGGTL
jgi:hypothetical protein